MEKPKTNYETLMQITKELSTLKEPENIILIVVKSITHALNVKGCCLFLYNDKSHELKVAGSFGLNEDFLNKGPISSLRSISDSLQDGQPMAVYDVIDDPRIQYHEAAREEGISSILSTPIIIGEKVLGCLQVYTFHLWEFELNDVNFVQALGQLVGMALEICRIRIGLKESVDILKGIQDLNASKTMHTIPHDSFPASFEKEEEASVKDTDIHIMG
jgi:signal transduction protein with GAF and PtsI domain